MNDTLNLTYITGNQHKADNLAKYLGLKLNHQKVSVDEIQSLDLVEVARHKAMGAFQNVQSPVLVEDTSLEFVALGRLPGTFIKFFLEELGAEKLCSIIPAGASREAIARTMYGYYDGNTFTSIEGSLYGEIAENPRGSYGYGWDQIFIPKNSNLTRAEMDESSYQDSYTAAKPMDKLKTFLRSIH